MNMLAEGTQRAHEVNTTNTQRIKNKRCSWITDFIKERAMKVSFVSWVAHFSLPRK